MVLVLQVWGMILRLEVLHGNGYCRCCRSDPNSGIVSDQTGSIMAAYVVPAVAFAVIAYYGFFIARKQELTTK